MTRKMLQSAAGVALAAGVLTFAARAQSAGAAQPASVPYTWKSVQIVGGGFVDGIVFHPTAKGVRYARTDMGGAYRWNDKTLRWDPILDWIPYQDLNLMGVESIALDASDPNRVYLACGTYTNPRTPDGAILRSADRGKTFQRTNVPIKFGGNENGRGNGERMSVDPNDGRILFLGTRHAGLWTSRDGAVTWSRVESFPNIPEESGPNERPWESRNNGVVFTLFDPHSGSKGKASQTIYAGVALKGPDSLFRSTDGGKSWQAVAGQPSQYRPTRAVLASDGTLYLSYGNNPGPARMSDGAVWKLNTRSGEWTDITPVKPDPEHGLRFGYAAVAVDAHNPRVVIASTFGRMNGAGGDDDIFRSADGGTTWKPVFGGGGTFDYSLAPYVARTPIHWLFDIEIDPANPDHAMFTTGYGGWETFNLRAMDSGRPTHWSVMSTGIEETVALELLSPPKGAHLITGVGDYGTFVHWDLDKPTPEGASEPPLLANTDGVACAENKPEVVVRVGRASNHHPGFNIGYSLDAGRSWQAPASMPKLNSASGHIAVSSDGETWVWTPRGDAPQVTRDRGKTWTECQGVPRNTRVIADRVNPRKFYALALFDGKLFVSTDGAASFAGQALALPDGWPKRGGNRGDTRGGQDRLYAAPGREGELWLAAFDGLYRSQDTGKSFVRLAGVQEIHGFGFGKAAPKASYPALYLVGVAGGARGIFRSDDTGSSWVRINDDQHQWGLVLHVTGDPKQYGRVYVGTHGRGTFYGDPVAAKR
ncbi:MAG: xyloglucanase [Bryobacteraceae bacterium]|nr:xyloglucanase [Bryobacteraceae bacterium]